MSYLQGAVTNSREIIMAQRVWTAAALWVRDTSTLSFLPKMLALFSAQDQRNLNKDTYQYFSFFPITQHVAVEPIYPYRSIPVLGSFFLVVRKLQFQAFTTQS